MKANQSKSPGQVSVETLLVISMLCLLLVFVLASVAQKNSDTAYYKGLFENQNTCNKLALDISIVFSSGKNSFLLHSLDKNVAVSEHVIATGNYSCSFIGNANRTDLNAGTIKIKNSNGVVFFEQA